MLPDDSARIVAIITIRVIGVVADWGIDGGFLYFHKWMSFGGLDLWNSSCGCLWPSFCVK